MFVAFIFYHCLFLWLLMYESTRGTNDNSQSYVHWIKWILLKSHPCDECWEKMPPVEWWGMHFCRLSVLIFICNSDSMRRKAMVKCLTSEFTLSHLWCCLSLMISLYRFKPTFSLLLLVRCTAITKCDDEFRKNFLF